MVQTREGAKTWVPDLVMALSAIPAASEAANNATSLMEKSKASENARLANETWFNKLDDGPTQDELMENFDAWNIYQFMVTTEKYRINVLDNPPGDNPIMINHTEKHTRAL